MYVYMCLGECVFYHYLVRLFSNMCTFDCVCKCMSACLCIYTVYVLRLMPSVVRSMYVHAYVCVCV